MKNRRLRSNRRRGFSFAELIISIGLLTLMLGMVAEINVAISEAVLRNDLHLSASEELNNIKEQIEALSYDEIATDTVNAMELIRTDNRLASWSFTCRVNQTTDDLPTKRIELVLVSPAMAKIQVSRVFWKSKPREILDQETSQ